MPQSPKNCSFPISARSQTRGFSLVETALAVGVIAFAFVGLFALLPAGLTLFRTAMDASVGAQIFQRVVTDIEQMEFDSLLDAGRGASGDFVAMPIRYFDDQGNEVQADDSARIVYHARARISLPGPAAVGGGNHFTSLPAPPGASRFALRDSVFVTLQVAHNPTDRPLPVDERLLWVAPPAQQQTLALATYSAVVTRNGHRRTP